MDEKKGVTAEQVRTLFDFDEGTGQLVWRPPHGSRSAGKPAGSIDRAGYVIVKINRKKHLGHRLVWMYQHGDDVPSLIDHIDGNKANNRPTNLRPANSVLNGENRRRASARSNTGLLGVQDQSRYCVKNPFKASIKANGKTHRLGAFPTAQAAHAAYVTAKRQLHAGNTL